METGRKSGGGGGGVWTEQSGDKVCVRGLGEEWRGGAGDPRGETQKGLHTVSAPRTEEDLQSEGSREEKKQ